MIDDTLAVALYSAKVHCRLNMTNLLFPDSFREAADFFSSLRPSPPATGGPPQLRLRRMETGPRLATRLPVAGLGGRPLAGGTAGSTGAFQR